VIVETERLDGKRRRTVIWVVVVDDDVLVRSVRGERGYWFQRALDRPGSVALIADGRTIPVRAVPAIDAQSIARCSAGLSAKYRGASLHSMLQPHTLETTLRLVPR
jgi:hypothetical protein